MLRVVFVVSWFQAPDGDDVGRIRRAAGPPTLG
jgi:hypothetical protein